MTQPEKQISTHRHSENDDWSCLMQVLRVSRSLSAFWFWCAGLASCQ